MNLKSSPLNQGPLFDQSFLFKDSMDALTFTGLDLQHYYLALGDIGRLKKCYMVYSNDER